MRLTARLRAHAAKLHISAGEAMELILPLARKQHAQDVYERSATAIWDEDQQAKESIPISSTYWQLIGKRRGYPSRGCLRIHSTQSYYLEATLWCQHEC